MLTYLSEPSIIIVVLTLYNNWSESERGFEILGWAILQSLPPF